MTKWVLMLSELSDDGSSYDQAWHVTGEAAAGLRARLGAPHGEYTATAEGNALRRETDGIAGVYCGPGTGDA